MEEDTQMSRIFPPGQRELERRKASKHVGDMNTNPVIPVHHLEVEHLIHMRVGDGRIARGCQL